LKFKSQFAQHWNGRKHQIGVTGIELLIGLSVISLFFAAASKVLDAFERTQYANGRAELLQLAGEAGDEYIGRYDFDIQSPNPIPLPGGGNVANKQAPTINELTQLGLFRGTITMPFPLGYEPSASIAVSVTLTPPGCLPGSCVVNHLTSFTRPWINESGNVDMSALGKLIDKIGASAAISDPGSPNLFKGRDGIIQFANPYNAAGHAAYFSGNGLPQYVRRQDTRDPNLQGGLTVNGTTTGGLTALINGAAAINQSLQVGGTATFANTVNVGGTLTASGPLVVQNGGTVCIRLLGSGQIQINCDGRLDARLGTFTGPSGTVRVGDTGTAFTVDTAGRIQASQGFYSAVGSVFGNNVNGIEVNGNSFTVQTAGGATQMEVNSAGVLSAAGGFSGAALGLVGTVNAGASCTQMGATAINPAANTTVRALAGGGIAVCSGGRWTAASRMATSGSACPAAGVRATDPADGLELLCRNLSGTLVYLRLGDLVSDYVTMNTFLVQVNQSVPAPVCGQRGTGVGTPLAIIIPRRFGLRNDSVANHFTEFDGTNFTVRVRNSNALDLPSEVLLETRCYY
jgi:type II secretory pathway pseudopilin PulG